MNLRLTIVAVKLFAVALFCGGCTDDDKNKGNVTTSAQPVISSVSPNAISRGQLDQEIRISGSNLSGVTALQMGDGINVQSFSSTNASEILAKVSASRTTSAGPRSITLTTAAGTATSSSVFSLSQNVAPIAKFKHDPISPGIDSVVKFDASNSEDDGDIATYHWDFGDGKSAKGKSTTHKYVSAGSFRVQLTVTDRNQATGTTGRELDVVRNKPPVARFSVSPGNGTTDTTFFYDASASSDPDGRIVDFLWRFGDGRTGNGKQISHTFGREGSYETELTVTDNKGSQANLLREIEVEKETGQRCSGKGGHGPGFLFTVVSADRGSRTIVGRFNGGAGCEAYYRCGDIRKGGYPGRSPGTEYWIGTICEFVDLGGGLARMKVSGGRYWPRAGESKLYTWPQLDGCSAPCR